MYLGSRLWFIDRFPYFSDEGTFALLSYNASQSLDDLFISMTIGHPPLHSWLGIPFVKLGFNALTGMRLVSVLAGLLTVLVVGLIGRRLGGNRIGLVAAGLCVVLPFFVVHQGIGIIESLVTLIMASALYLQLELARRPDLRVAVLLGVVLAAATLTKENTKPALVLVPLGLLCFDWSEPGRRERLRTWLSGIAIVAAMVIAAQLLLRSSSLYSQLEATRASPFYTVRSVSEVLSDPFGSWGNAWSSYRPAFFEYISIPLLGAAAAGALLAWRRNPRLTALLLAWIALPLFVSFSFATFPFPRHVMYLVPPAIVLMAYAIVAGVDWIRRTLPSRAGSAVAVAAVVLLLLPALRLDWRVLAHPASAHYPGLDDEQYVTGTGGGSVWPEVADEIRRRAAAGTVVIVHPTANPTRLQLLLGPDSRYVFVRGSSPLARRAQFAITDRAAQPFVDREALAVMRERSMDLLRRFPRPRGGTVVKLYGS